MRVDFITIMTETVYEYTYAEGCSGSFLFVPESHINFLKYEVQSTESKYHEGIYYLHDEDCNRFAELWERELRAYIQFQYSDKPLDVSGFKSVAVIKPSNNLQRDYNKIPYDIRKAITKYLFLQDSYKTGTKELPTIQQVISDFHLNFKKESE